MRPVFALTDLRGLLQFSGLSCHLCRTWLMKTRDILTATKKEKWEKATLRRTKRAKRVKVRERKMKKLKVVIS